MIGNLPIIGDIIGDASIRDVIFALLIPLFITMTIVGSLPESYGNIGFGIMLIVFLLGVSVLAAVPDYTSFSGLISTYLSFKRRAKESRKVNSETDEEVEHRIWETSESTVEQTGVSKIYGEKGVIEREDGAIVGAMKINGANLDTATERSVREVTQQFANFVNNNLSFPIQIYLTTRRFNPETFLEKYENRLDDPEIQGNDMLELYIDHYTDRTPRFLSRYYYREYYILIPVTVSDVVRESREEGALNLSAIPGGIGELLADLFGSSSFGEITEKQIKQRQIDEVKKRLEKVSRNGIEGLGDANAEVITDANHYAALIKEFWEGRDLSFKRDKNFVRETPVVSKQNNKEEQLENTI